MGLWMSFAGQLRVKITSPNCERDLSQIVTRGISVEAIKRIDDLNFMVTIPRQDFTLLADYLTSNGANISINKQIGIYWYIFRILKRPVLLVGILFYVFLLISIPNHIFFYKIHGNSVVSTERILYQVQQCGLTFGTHRRSIRSEQIKNDLLQRIPELRWAGVNTYGCVAVIEVKENEPQSHQTEALYNSIVANRDGIIDEIVVNRGNLLCRVGQVAVKDQLLVSGYIDCGNSIRFCGVDAEIYAITKRQVNSAMPLFRQYRIKEKDKEEKYSVYFGKKRINLYKGSGISCTECDKMYMEYCLSLPGGFVLPVGIIKETTIHYALKPGQMSADKSISVAKDLSSTYLNDQMIAGKVLRANYNTDSDERTLNLLADYRCREMIGKYYNKEYIATNE